MRILFIILLLSTLLVASLSGCSRAPSRTTGTIEDSWFPHVDGIFVKGEYIDLNTNNTERLYIRYGPISDSGVELEKTTNSIVLWRVHVKPVGDLEYSKYHNDVRVRIWDNQIWVTSTGAKQIFEVRSLKTGAFISRKVTNVLQQRHD
jgi:hypothetical protein